jgi:hypothetical protein
MREASLASGLLFTALGLTLAFAPRKAWLPSLLVLLLSGGTFELLQLPPAWVEVVFAGCWISVAVTALSVYLGQELPSWAALLFSLNAGIWASAVVLISGSRSEAAFAMPCVLAFLPASWLVRRYGPIPIKVASSWLIAIAVLAATLQILPVAAGYLPDHLE